MRAALTVGPKAAGRIAIAGRTRCRSDGSANGGKRIPWIIALIIAGVHTARVVRQVLLLLDVPVEITTRVDQLELLDAAGDRQLRILPLVVIVGRIEQLYPNAGQRFACTIAAFLPEHPS